MIRVLEQTADTLHVHVAPDRDATGRQAASDIARDLRARLARQARVRIVFAAAPSQSEMIEALILERDIDWNRIDAFHMDEYIGLPADAPQRFGAWLTRMLFARVPFGSVHLLSPDEGAEAAARNYAHALEEAPIDIVCLGIGANGHLAFNDPPADLDDPADVRIVALDEACRRQQVDDECFDEFDAVPTHALTLTVPRLLRADRLFCVVPGIRKRAAVTQALYGPIDGDCPASALRRHPRCTLYLDRESQPDGQ